MVEKITFLSRSRVIVFIIISLYAVIVAGRYSRITSSVSQVSVAIMSGGEKSFAVTGEGDVLSSSLTIDSNKTHSLSINLPQGLKEVPKTLELSGSSPSALEIESPRVSGINEIKIKDLGVRPEAGVASSYIVVKNPSSFRYTIWTVLGIMAFVAILAYTFLKTSAWASISRGFNTYKTVFRWYDNAFMIIIAILSSLYPMGCDIEVIARFISLSNLGVDVYSYQILKKMADGWPFPGFPYPPFTLALLSPIQFISDVIISPTTLAIFGKRAESCGLELASMACLFAVVIMVSVKLYSIGAISKEKIRGVFYSSVLAPGVIYLVAGFQQIDIFGVALMCAGLILITSSSRAWLLGAVAIGIALGVKPQNLIMAPVVVLFFMHCMVRGQRNAFFIELTILLSTLSIVVINILTSQFKSYHEVVSGFSIIDRLRGHLWAVSPDILVYSAPLFVGISMAVIWSAWRAPRNEPDYGGLVCMLGASSIVCAYQASIMHTPGLSMYIILGLSVTMGLLESWIDRVGVMIASALAVSYWPFLPPGDAGRPFRNFGITFVSDMLSGKFHVEYVSMLYTLEMLGLVILSGLFINRIVALGRMKLKCVDGSYEVQKNL